jgi:ATP-dependent DNA helicase RecQ
VVPLPSSRHPQLVRSVAEAVGRIGQIPVLDALAITGRASADDLSAKARAGFQAGRLSLRANADLSGADVLLVDDRWQTGWTATIAAAVLREAGARNVLPMVIHQQP